MSTLTLSMAIIIAILLVFLVFTVALMRTQREDALFEHNVDIDKLTDVTEKYTELRHFEAAQVLNIRGMASRLEVINDELLTLREQQALRGF